MPTHAAIWIDHTEARIFHLHSSAADRLHRELVDETTVLAPQHRFHRHSKSPTGEAAEHPEDATHYFQQVAHALSGTDEVLIVGPASAKLELFKYLHEHATGTNITGMGNVQPLEFRIAQLRPLAGTCPPQ